MNNDLVDGLKEKLIGCRRIFMAGIICSATISIFNLFLVFGLFNDGSYGLAAYVLFFLLAIILSGFILFREKKIIGRLINRIDLSNNQISIVTIFNRKAKLNSPIYVVLKESWIKKRRIWPSYFVPRIASGISPRYDWKNIKCIAIGSFEDPFYWISNDESLTSDLLLKLTSANYREI